MERPELVRSVVVGEPGISALIETDPGAREVLEARARASAEVDQAIQAGDPQRAAILLFDQVCGEEGAFHKVSEERKRRWLDNAKTIGLRRAQEAVRSFRHEELGRIIRPILVVRGERTTPFHALATKAVLSSLPAGTIETVIPDAGHLSYADQPGAFGDAVMFFLARCAVMRRLPSSST
jgi:pimeloyl-ACP methyl ester carboxylesterase